MRRLLDFNWVLFAAMAALIISTSTSAQSAQKALRNSRFFSWRITMPPHGRPKPGIPMVFRIDCKTIF